jgi:hypothetical protein
MKGLWALLALVGLSTALAGCGNSETDLSADDKKQQEEYLKNGIDMSKTKGGPTSSDKPSSSNLSPATPSGS